MTEPALVPVPDAGAIEIAMLSIDALVKADKEPLPEEAEEDRRRRATEPQRSVRKRFKETAS